MFLYYSRTGGTRLPPPAYVTLDPLSSRQIIPPESRTQPPISGSRPSHALNLTPSARMRGHTSSVRCAAFSSDGRQIASGSADGTCRVWDATSGDCRAGPFEGHTNGVWSIALSPDGCQIACGSSDNLIRVWNAQTGNQ